jgi:hypothetical protein
MKKFDILLVILVFSLIVWYLATHLPEIIKGF